MSAVPVTRLSMFPVAVVAATSVALAPVAIPTITPNALVAAVVSRTQDVVGSIEPAVASAASDVASTVADISVSAVGLLAHTPTLLRTVSTHELARFVALPAATSPLLPSVEHAAGDGAGVGTAAAPASVAAIVPFASLAATDPAADLLAALQSAFGKIQDAVVSAPGNVVMSIGQLLSGDVRTSLQTFTNILIQPLVLIGLTDLPNIAAPLAKLTPVLAPVINALPDIAINISVSALQLIIDVREGVADTYEGVRTGLSNGDLGAALNSFVTGLTTIAQKGITDVVGQYGVISSLVDAGDRLLKAIGQIGAPVAKATTAAVTAAAATTAIATTATKVASRTTNVTPTTAGDGAAPVSEKDAPTATGGTKDRAATSESVAGTSSSTTSDEKLGADPTAKSDNATKTDDTKTDDTKTDDTKTDDTKTDDTKTGTTKSGTTKSDDTKKGTTKSDDSKKGTTKSGTAKTGATESSTGGSGSPAEHDKTAKSAAAAG